MAVTCENRTILLLTLGVWVGMLARGVELWVRLIGLLFVYVGCFDFMYTKEKLKTDTAYFNGIICVFVLANPALYTNFPCHQTIDHVGSRSEFYCPLAFLRLVAGLLINTCTFISLMSCAASLEIS